MYVVPVVPSTMTSCMALHVCVLDIKPSFLPVDIQQNQCPGRFFNPIINNREIQVVWHCMLYSGYCITIYHY